MSLIMAQQPSAPPPLSSTTVPQSRGEKQRGEMNLSPEMRTRMEAARKKALEDPQLQKLRAEAEAARQKFQSALKEGMRKADPGLKDELQKSRADNPGGPGMHHRETRHSGLGNLSSAEKQQLMTAHQAAEKDPSVIAAKATQDSATDHKQRHAAEEAYHKAMHDAMLKADPSLQPILEKLKAGKSHPQPSSSPAT